MLLSYPVVFVFLYPLSYWYKMPGKLPHHLSLYPIWSVQGQKSQWLRRPWYNWRIDLLMSLLKAEMANHLVRYATYLLETYMDFFWSYSETPYWLQSLIWGRYLPHFFFFLKAVSTSLTESTLKNVPQVVNVRELKTGALTPAVSTVIGWVESPFFFMVAFTSACNRAHLPV